MNLKQLRYFCAIAEERHIGRTAERLHISPPPLSLQLKLMEEEPGVRLIERSTRHLRLTQAAHAFYQRAYQILDMVGMTVEEMRNIGHGYPAGVNSVDPAFGGFPPHDNQRLPVAVVFGDCVAGREASVCCRPPVSGTLLNPG